MAGTHPFRGESFLVQFEIQVQSVADSNELVHALMDASCEVLELQKLAVQTFSVVVEVLEIPGFKTADDQLREVLGWLSAEDVIGEFSFRVAADVL